MRTQWLLLAVLLSGCSMLPPVGRVVSQQPAGEPTVASFQSSVEAVTAELLAYSWRPGCPVDITDLRLLTLSHWGFDGRIHTGHLVAHVDHAEGLIAVMRTLYEHEFPIERMELVDAYDGDDDASMAANNTSAFNCREVSRRPGAWSQHAFGTALDINPVQNPYILRDGTVLPPGAVTDRAIDVPGLVSPGDVVVRAFESIGWGWGGYWDGVKDYQHFSAGGR